MRMFKSKKGAAAKERRPIKVPSLGLSLVPVLGMLVFMGVGSIWLDLPAEPMVILAAVVAGLVAIGLGHTFNGLMQVVAEKIAKVMPALLILITVGFLIGAWMAGGTIPLMVHFGLDIVSPRFLYLTALVVTSIVAIFTGTSWGSVGTIGVAFMGVAISMDGVSLAVTAGAIVSGAYFGDKLSPLSDTTNLAAAVTRIPLYEHIRNLLWTTGPSWLLAAIIMFFMGFTVNPNAGGGEAKVAAINGALDTGFAWNFWLLIPIIIVLGGSMLKMPTIPVMLFSSGVAMVNAVVFQHISISNVFNAVTSGFNVDMLGAGFNPGTAADDINTLLNRGGMLSMMSTLLIAFCALVFAGIMAAMGSLEVIVNKLLTVAKSTGSMILATIGVGMMTIATTCNGQISILMPGEMLREAFIRRNLSPKNLGRTLEDSATIIEPILPWTAAGAYMAATLGVATVSYVGWATLCWTGIIFAAIWGFTGIGISRISDEEKAKLLAEIEAENELGHSPVPVGA